MRRIRVFEEHYATNPGHDTGISHAIVLAAGTGSMPETLRLHRTTDIVAFGRHDTITPGYGRAVKAAIEQGFTPIERLAGGRAAVFHTGTLAFAWAIPTSDPREGVTARFAMIAEILREALRSLGVDANIGELPGEYCPGAYSIHADNRVKLVGVGQRLVRGAAHIGGVICVKEGERIRAVLEPVYRELTLDWDPNTAGAIDEFAPDVSVESVRKAVLDAFTRRFSIEPARMPPEMVAKGLALAPTHISAG